MAVLLFVCTRINARHGDAGRSAALGRERLTKWAASSSHDEARVRVVRVVRRLGAIVEALDAEQRKKPFLVT